MTGNTGYFFQSLFRGFTMLGMAFFASLIYLKVKKNKDIEINTDEATNIWIFVALMIIITVVLSAYGFGGAHEYGI